MTMKIFATAVLASALFVTSALAQTAGQHNEHHPADASAPATPTTPNDRPGAPWMMNMMGDGMNMSGMMQMMNGMHGGMGGCMSGPQLDRIEGRIAFLRAELRITDSQNAVWNAFANALRVQAQKSSTSSDAMSDGGSLLDRIDRQERALATKIENVRTLKAAIVPLLSAMSDEQKKTADQLLGPYFGAPMMGMTGMTGGVMGNSGMGGEMMQGGMKPGAGNPMQRMGR